MKLLVSLVLAALVVVVEPTRPLTTHVVFVVDRSGSMAGGAFRDALTGFREVAGAPVDELEIAMIAFNNTTVRWPGKPDEETKTKPGWAALPSATAIDEAEAWLLDLGAGGDTYVIPALAEALQLDTDELSIVLVSDGCFGHERDGEVLGVVAGLQAQRVQRGLKPALIAVYQTSGFQTRLLEALGRDGGYLRVEPEAPLLPFGPY